MPPQCAVYGACLFNSLVALWMVMFFQCRRERDLRFLCFLAELIGLSYVIVVVSMLKRIESAPCASHPSV